MTAHTRRPSSLRKISTHTLTWSVTRFFDFFPSWFNDFNSHAHVERDFHNRFHRTSHLDFNSHAHVERDSYGFYSHSSGSNFNSHAHVERDLSTKKLGLCSANFNSHAHVERDLYAIYCSMSDIAFQLTRSRGA